MRSVTILLIAVCGLCTVDETITAAESSLFHAMGEMAGEVSEPSVILQSRLTASPRLINGDVPGAQGVARFEISVREDFRRSQFTNWLKAEAVNDFIVKVRVGGLRPGTPYFYRLHFGASEDTTEVGDSCSFHTLQGASGAEEASFVVVTGMEYVAFNYGIRRGRIRTMERAYRGADKHLGFSSSCHDPSDEAGFLCRNGRQRLLRQQ